MSTLDQLASQIRFQLEQLSERNGHHDFEHLCRWLARKRICSNILPATGPVSAFGDQGRDFETFRTYLNQSHIADSSFIGLASEGPIAFACTLTKEEKIESKIKSDIETIMESGTHVVDIHYFCIADIPSGLRHKLQEWAKKEKNTLLEIHDGHAISEDLTDQDIFWLAERYLNIPAELYPTPTPEKAGQWYLKLLENWKDADYNPSNYVDFYEIKTAIRHATFTDVAKKDLPFWIKQMEMLINSTSFDSLKQKATYEIAVATLRGLGSLVGYEDQLSLYFDKVPQITTPSDLEDATTLCTYCIGAYYHNEIEVTLEDLNKWRSSIANKIESELQATTQPGTRCLLLQTRGLFYLMPSPEHADSDAMEKTFDSWLELALLVDKAHLFPLESFADHLTQFLELPGIGLSLGNHPNFPNLTRQIDELLTRRHGGFVAAEKCRNRAMAFYKRGEILRAIKEIHKAKIQWFAKEALRGSLLATLYVLNCYQQLGLVFAAKYYALATAYIAIHNSDSNVYSLISTALNSAATCDYSIGAFCGFFDFTDTGLAAWNTFSKAENALDPESEIAKTLFHSSILHTITKSLNPGLLKLVDNRIKNWRGLEEYSDEYILEVEKIWSKKNLPDIWVALEEQMYDRPFSDLGQFRSIQFRALGVTWKFKWENIYELTSIVEEILAVVQVLLADIADTDWYLLRTTVEVEVGFGKDSEVGLHQIPSNELGQWRLMLSNIDTENESDHIALQLAATLLEYSSLLPTEQFNNRIGVAFNEGLAHKIFFGQRFSKLYREFITKEKFENSNRATLSPPEPNRPFKSVLHQQLPWYGGPGPGYDNDTAAQALKNRYERSVIPIQHTLKQLSQEKSYKDTVHFLHDHGWLDWHILNATSLIVINYRINKEIGLQTNPERFKQRFKELMNQPEDENADPVPISEFTEENLRRHLWISMGSTLKNLGFELHQITPDFEAISDFLGERYRYWTDDIDHTNYFA